MVNNPSTGCDGTKNYHRPQKTIDHLLAMLLAVPRKPPAKCSVCSVRVTKDQKGQKTKEKKARIKKAKSSVLQCCEPADAMCSV